MESMFNDRGYSHAVASSAPSSSPERDWRDLRMPMAREEGSRPPEQPPPPAPPAAYDSMLLAHDVQNRRPIGRDRHRIGPRIGPAPPTWQPDENDDSQQM